LNVAVVFDDAAILTDVAVAAITYAAFALEPLNGELISVTTAGNYTGAHQQTLDGLVPYPGQGRSWRPLVGWQTAMDRNARL
jgi:hypothetical protein